MKYPGPFIASTIMAMLLLSVSPPVRAQSTSYFDDKITYDIYFSNSEETRIIKSVQIMGFQEIGEKLFLVVQPNGFNLKDYSGFILFDSVQAILPDRNFQVDDSQKQR